MTDRKFTPPTEFPKKQVQWTNDYGDGLGDQWHDSRHYADCRKADADRIAVIRREWVEGQPPQYFAEEV